MKPIWRRLRGLYWREAYDGDFFERATCGEQMLEAANEGERLCAEVERLRAALSKATGALSAIAYLVGPPNEKELSFYDVFPDEERLVKAVQNRLAERGSGK